MKKSLKIVFSLFICCMLMMSISTVHAQCAQCAANVATNKSGGGNAANGLNKGILFLLAAPYLAVAVVGTIWYKKYRRKNIDIHIRNEKLHLN